MLNVETFEERGKRQDAAYNQHRLFVRLGRSISRWNDRRDAHRSFWDAERRGEAHEYARSQGAHLKRKHAGSNRLTGWTLA